MHHDVLGENAYEWAGSVYKTLVSTEESNGSFSITDNYVPLGDGPPRHIHADADEFFVVMQGQADFWLEGEIIPKKAGESVRIPRGKEHTFQVTGDGPARLQIIFAPGGFEGFFQEMSAQQCRLPDDMDKIVEIGNRYHITFTGPPLGAE